MHDTFLHRVLGGSPPVVAVRLLFVSLIVGAVMSWLDIEPFALFAWLRAAALHLWATGFDGLRQIGRYVAAGAAVVVPVWIVLRVMSAGSADTRRTSVGRWRLPGDAPPNTRPDGRD